MTTDDQCLPAIPGYFATLERILEDFRRLDRAGQSWVLARLRADHRRPNKLDEITATE